MRKWLSCARIGIAYVAAHRVRTGLLLVSLTVTYALLMVLDGVVAAASADPSGNGRLMIRTKYPMYALPYAIVERIAALDGVRTVTPLGSIGAYYGEARNAFMDMAVEPAAYSTIFRLGLSDTALRCLAEHRRGALAAPDLVAKHGWTVGGSVPLMSTYVPTEAGGFDWEFRLCGTLDDGAHRSTLLYNFAYLDEFRAQGAGTIGAAYVLAADPSTTVSIADAIDGLYANSSHPTASVTMDALERAAARRIGDLVAISAIIGVAALFSLALLQCLSAMQSASERAADLAVMRTMGFGPGAVRAMTFAETWGTSMVGAAAGAAAGLVLEPALVAWLDGAIGTFDIRPSATVTVAVCATVIGVAGSLAAEWRSRAGRGGRA